MIPKIYVVGMGPGNRENMTLRCIDALEDSDVIIGYSKYIELLQDYYNHKTLISSPMKKEVDRCIETINIALSDGGKTVSLVSSGDSGIYGMAGVLLETADRMGFDGEIEIIPGVTALSAAASALGAPVVHDFAVISLSDLLTPLGLIEKRLKLAAEGDFVICLYNPKSKKRTNYVDMAVDIILKHRSGKTPVGIVRNACREDESCTICTLDTLKEQHVDMFSTIIIGNSQSYESLGKIITPRGYKFD